jgi:hypothetical protein
MSANTSPYISDDKVLPESDSTDKTDIISKGVKFIKKNYVYIVLGIIMVCVIYWIYFSFYKGQQSSFIVKTIKTGRDSDKVFDVETHINILREMQEKYLLKLKK